MNTKTMTVRRMGDRLFVTKRGWMPQLKALWYLATHYPIAFLLAMDTAVLTRTNPGTVALLCVIEVIPEWKSEARK